MATVNSVTSVSDPDLPPATKPFLVVETSDTGPSEPLSRDVWLDPPSPNTGTPSSNESIPLLTFFLKKAEKFVDHVPDRCGGACGVMLPTTYQVLESWHDDQFSTAAVLPRMKVELRVMVYVSDNVIRYGCSITHNDFHVQPGCSTEQRGFLTTNRLTKSID
jgi:hypothetical protein